MVQLPVPTEEPKQEPAVEPVIATTDFDTFPPVYVFVIVELAVPCAEPVPVPKVVIV